MDITTLIMLGGAIFWVGILGWAVYSYRQKTEARERERSMRYEQFIGATLAGGGPASGTGPAGSGIAGLAANTGIDPARLAAAFMASQDAAGGRTAASGRAAAAPVAAQAPVLPAPAYRLRERVLEKPQALAFYAIKAAVPDHEVFIGLSLADLLDVPDTLRGYDRDLRLKKLMPLVVDFAIVNKAMQLVAVIDLEDVKSTPEQREAQRAKAECLRPFPVRQLTFPRERLPRYQDIRQLLQSPG